MPNHWQSRMPVVPMWTRWTAIVVVALLGACGGGRGSDTAVADLPDAAPEQPFGLTERAPLGVFVLPSQENALADYTLVSRFPGLNFPAAVFFAGVPGENRAVVVQQSGFVRVFVNDIAANTSHTVLDISAQVLHSGEQGLLGLAFDPDFSTNRFFTFTIRHLAARGGPSSPGLAGRQAPTRRT